MTHQTFSKLLFAAALPAFVALPSALAQRTGRPDGAGAKFTAEYSYSGSNDVKRNGVAQGEVSVDEIQLSVASALPVGEGMQLLYGLAYERYDLHKGATALPGELTGVSVPMGLMKRFSKEWSSLLLVRTGFFGDGAGFSGDQWNTPVLATATYRVSPELAWIFGARYDAWSRQSVIPFLGVDWNFAPDWRFTVGMPSTGVTWTVAKGFETRLGASFQGGGYHVKDDPRRGGNTGLADSHLDYTEIRVGVGAEYEFSPALTISADAGAIVYQKFDYLKRDFTLRGNGAPFASLSLVSRF